jgi:hypothetical protein
MTKYFCGLKLPIAWMIDPTTLPPSRAGIGSRLNSARDNEISHANARAQVTQSLFVRTCHALIAQAGPLIIANPSLVVFLSNEINLDQIDPNAVSVNLD